jgi:hypothetical protein
MKKLACLWLMTALAVWAADVTGKWSGSFEPIGAEGQGDTGTALLVLTQKGTEITGTVGPDEGQRFDIQKGSIEGDKITLAVENEGRSMRFALVLDGDHIKGEATMTQGDNTRKAKLDLTRAK